MSRCNWCRNDGLIFIRDRFDDGLAAGYTLAACCCPYGKRWRTKDQLKAKAHSLVPKPMKFGRLEEFFSEAELRTLTTTHEIYDPS